MPFSLRVSSAGEQAGSSTGKPKRTKEMWQGKLRTCNHLRKTQLLFLGAGRSGAGGAAAPRAFGGLHVAAQTLPASEGEEGGRWMAAVWRLMRAE